MQGKVILQPGNPNDENRHYLPEAIKGSDMVVNENGNNSQKYPERLKECSEILADGSRYNWYEYVPASYDATKKVPLVLAMHGGMMTGWAQAVYTCWTLVADREGFIVLFPDATQHRFWIVEVDRTILDVLGKPNPEGFYLNQFPKDPDENRDMNFMLQLIERTKQKYNIDESRIYMQGMSMGDMMTNQFARYHGRLLAAQAGSGGPTHLTALYDEQGQIKNRDGALAVWQARMELDQAPPSFGDSTDVLVKRNREYWKTINQCNSLPEIRIEGEDNFAFYQGELADYVFRDVKNRDHGQTLDDAELVWDYLFSGVKRENGKIVHTEPACPRTGDRFAVALAVDKTKAFVNNELMDVGGEIFKHQKLKYHGLNGGSIVRGEYFMAPVSFIAKVYNAEHIKSKDGTSAALKLEDGRELQFARGSIGCVVENEVHSMLCEAVYRDGELYAPIEWVSRYVFNNHASDCDGVLYITDHDAVLSLNMAHLIRDEILC